VAGPVEDRLNAAIAATETAQDDYESKLEAAVIAENELEHARVEERAARKLWDELRGGD
jgi:hypothetical protein